MADFVSAMTNLTTAETAKLAARQSEQATLQTIESANPQYVTPGDLSPEVQDQLVRSSLNAHLQKVQADQIISLTDQQLSQTEIDDKQKYIGKKARITVLDRKFQPLESYWFNDKTGQEREGVLKSKSINGIIHDLSFRKNVLLLKPTLKSRILLPDRKFIFVYVINPETLIPAVDISLI